MREIVQVTAQLSVQDVAIGCMLALSLSLTIAQIVALLRNSRPTILNLAPERIRAHRLKGGQRVK
jgi:hypothetical protein